MHGDAFARFEHESWQRVAEKYDSVWSSLTRQFIPHLLADANVSAGMSILPEGPPKYLYGEREECGQVLARTGFDDVSMSYETRTVEWHLSDARYYFEAE
jgi:hypothetical protein